MPTELFLLHSASSPRAREAARTCATNARQKGFSVETSELSSFAQEELLNGPTVVLFLDVQQSEELSDDAVPFWLHLNSLNQGALRNLRFAVFAFGDACHGQFCALGNACNVKLAHLGGFRLHPFTTCRGDNSRTLPSWTRSVLEKINPGLGSPLGSLAA